MMKKFQKFGLGKIKQQFPKTYMCIYSEDCRLDLNSRFHQMNV